MAFNIPAYLLDFGVAFGLKSWVVVPSSRKSAIESSYLVVLSFSSMIIVALTLTMFSFYAWWSQRKLIRSLAPGCGNSRRNCFKYAFDKVNVDTNSAIVNVAISCAFSLMISLLQEIGVIISTSMFSAGFLKSAFWTLLTSEMFYFSYFRVLFTQVKDLGNMIAMVLLRYLTDDLLRFIIPMLSLSFNTLSRFKLTRHTSLRRYRRDLLWRVEIHMLVGVVSIGNYIVNLLLIKFSWNVHYFVLTDKATLSTMLWFNLISLFTEVIQWIVIRHIGSYACEAHPNLGQLLERDNKKVMGLLILTTLYILRSNRENVGVSIASCATSENFAYERVNLILN
ncbi:hypothetical protein HDU67_006578 [Dinochytrium kinnereticum]|nr:hypothetical protein HDU67_006578 [Dinochytrium kinnereticum]